MINNYNHRVHPAPMLDKQTPLHSLGKTSHENSVSSQGKEDSTKNPLINRSGEKQDQLFPPNIHQLIKEDEENESCDSLLGTPKITPGTTPTTTNDNNDIETNYKALKQTDDLKEENPQSLPQRLYYLFPESQGISNDLFHHSKHVYPITRKLLLYMILTFLGLLIYLGDDIYVHNFLLLPSTTSYNDGSPSYRLTFIGDSLIHRPYVEFDLGGRLQRHFTTINLNITDRSVEGNTIERCRKTIENDVPVGSADMVLLFWDTDVSDYDESSMTSEEVTEKRSKYLEDLTYVINVVKSAGVSYIAMSGPNLLGEATIFTFLLPPYIVGKKKMLNEYVEINRNASKSLSVDYINMRQAFLQHLPSSWFLPLYYLTYDGEHPNERGAGIIALEFAYQIAQWINVPIKKS